MQIAKWRKTAMDQLPELFVDGRKHQHNHAEAENTALYEEIGRLKVELDWLKKKLACSTEDRRPLVDRDHREISVRRQCELLSVSRASLYYQPRGESEENQPLMQLIDEQYTRTPFYGSRKLVAGLGEKGFVVNRKRVSRLMEVMGLEAVYPKPKLSQPGKATRSTRIC
jgi:putative transposase